MSIVAHVVEWYTFEWVVSAACGKSGISSTSAAPRAFQTQPPSGEVAEECATESQKINGTKCTARETVFPILSPAALLAGRVNTPSGTHHGLFNIFLASDICFSHFGFRSPRGANEKNAFGFFIEGEPFLFCAGPLRASSQTRPAAARSLEQARGRGGPAP